MRACLITLPALLLFLACGEGEGEESSVPDALTRPEPGIAEMAAWRCAGRDWTHRGVYSGDAAGEPVELWRLEVGGTSFAWPVAAPGIVVAADEAGNVVAADPSTGEERWRVELGEPVRGAPAVTDGSVYLSLGRGAVVSLDRITGRVRWRVELAGPCDVGPTPYGNLLYVPDESGALFALDALTGDVVWIYASSAGI
ncbi:PQQ-like beta-propeller repeat protein, partial [bacterium]|nr:PQQ-like beta-propeller repeat protein [bacterium]